MDNFSIPKKEREWVNKTKFFQDVLGKDIISSIDIINNSDDSFVVATQPFPRGFDSNGNSKFDVFIYYKEKRVTNRNINNPT